MGLRQTAADLAGVQTFNDVLSRLPVIYGQLNDEGEYEIADRVRTLYNVLAGWVCGGVDRQGRRVPYTDSASFVEGMLDRTAQALWGGPDTAGACYNATAQLPSEFKAEMQAIGEYLHDKGYDSLADRIDPSKKQDVIDKFGSAIKNVAKFAGQQRKEAIRDVSGLLKVAVVGLVVWSLAPAIVPFIKAIGKGKKR